MSRSPAEALHPTLRYHLVNSLGWPSLHPLQEAAVAPLLAGRHAQLLAPTAGGKTEAALLPTLTRMAGENWLQLSVLYLCPLRALLNNLLPRLELYAGWLGRRVGLWHGDVGDAARRRMLADPPDVLLTTPESLEAMLISLRVDAPTLFAGLRAVIVDEVHAFAADDRGWHLRAVLERLSRLAGRDLQRVGLSATVGAPDRLLRWFAPRGPAEVIAPPTSGAATPEVTLDHVGGLDNAATVISRLHRGEKRLVFCEGRAQVEQLAGRLRALDVTVFLSHGSLGREVRHQAERAFAEARNCVIVSTRTLELGLDVGDLDRVVQIDAPTSVAGFLQRLGRTGRRPGTARNTLFLTTDQAGLLRAAGLAHLWSSGFVEPATPPPFPAHLAAQQLLGLVLQAGTVGRHTWASDWLGTPGPLGEDVDAELADLTTWMVEQRLVHEEAGILGLGQEADDRFGWRNFRELTSAFTAAPELAVLFGRADVGSVSPLALSAKRDGPLVLLLAGRAWRVRDVDWRRRRVYVEPTELRGRARWAGGAAPLSFELCQAMRAVLAGDEPGVTVSRRADEALALRRQEAPWARRDGSTVMADGLKFADCLPRALAERVVAQRLADPEAVAAVLAEPIHGRVIAPGNTLS